MKKLTFVILSLLLASTSNAQYGYTSLNFVPALNDSAKIKITTGFLLGGGTDCPEMKYYSITTGSDTLFISAYYDVSGMWAAFGCTSVDTVNLGVLPITTKVITVLPYEYTTVPADTYGHAPVSILKSLAIQQLPVVGKVFSVSPNPATDYLQIGAGNEMFGAAYITDLTGRVVKRFNQIIGRLDISDLPGKALYILHITTNSDGHTCKFSKE